MTADLAGNREFGASMPRFWPADAKNGQIMQKYFDRDRKLFQIAWQSSKGGVRLAMQG